MASIGPISETILNRAPKYLRGPNIGRFLESAGLVCDTIIQTAAEGFKLSNPLKCDVSAFPSLSKDRKIRLYPTEPEASKRYRLAHWRQIRRHDASCYGSMLNLQPYFLPGTLPVIRCVHQSGDPGTGCIATWHTLDAAGEYTIHRPVTSNFNYDDQPTKWSRWWCFIDMSGTAISGGVTYGSGHTYGDGSVYGGGLTPAQTADIAQLLIDSNPPHAWLAGVILTYTAGAVDPTGTPTQDADGRWSLPNGANTWSVLVDPTTGKATRPTTLAFVYENPA